MFSTFLSLVPLALLAASVTAESRPRAVHNSLAKRLSGELAKRYESARWSFYDVGLGACGQYNVGSDFIVALNAEQFGSGYPGPNCFKKIQMSYNGKTTTATIMDRCPGCPYGGLDLSRGLFTFFASEDIGILYGSWNFVGDTAGPATTQAWVAPTTTTQAWVAPTTTTKAWVPPTTTTKAWVAPTTTTKAWVAPTTETWVAPTTSTKAWVAPTQEAWVPPTTSTKAWVAPTTSSTKEWVAPTTSSTKEWVAPTTSSTKEWVAPTTSSTKEWIAPTTSSTKEWVAPTISSTKEWVAPTTSSKSSAVPTTLSTKKAVKTSTVSSSTHISSSAVAKLSSTVSSSASVTPVPSAAANGLTNNKAQIMDNLNELNEVIARLAQLMLGAALAQDN